MDSVAIPGPPAVMMFGRSTSLNASMARIRITVAATGAICGQAISRKICKLLAPSTCPASTRSRDTFSSAASRTTKMKGIHCQESATMMINLAAHGLAPVKESVPDCGSNCGMRHCDRCHRHIHRDRDEEVTFFSHDIETFHRDLTHPIVRPGFLALLCGDCASDLDVDALTENLKHGVYRRPEGPGIPDQRPEASLIWRAPVAG